MSVKPNLLLHICCIGCGVYIVQTLKDEFDIQLFFYNPNIFPKDEYDKRLAEIKKVAQIYNLEVIIGDYDHHKWLLQIRGHEQDAEKGERCLICYQARLIATAQMAKENNFQFFGTTLTISPHKDAAAIIKIGKDLEKEYGLRFLDKDFKKQDGFKKSAVLSKELGLYRQNYCGCEFSKRLRNT